MWSNLEKQGLRHLNPPLVSDALEVFFGIEKDDPRAFDLLNTHSEQIGSTVGDKLVVAL